MAAGKYNKGLQKIQTARALRRAERKTKAQGARLRHQEPQRERNTLHDKKRRKIYNFVKAEQQHAKHNIKHNRTVQLHENMKSDTLTPAEELMQKEEGTR